MHNASQRGQVLRNTWNTYSEFENAHTHMPRMHVCGQTQSQMVVVLICF